MGFQDFISEAEAISLTGMSKNTLSRFAEAGYLQLEVDTDGLRLFSKGELSGLFGLREGPARPRSVPEAPPKREAAKSAAPEKAVAPPNSEMPPTAVPPPTLEAQVEKVVEPSPSVTANSDQTLEIQRLRNVLQLQEQILDLKDQQLKDLREQRDWLQARVEKLEDKADRDQILLMTETQTIRTLVNLNKQVRRSPVRLALEWLGVAAPAEPPQATESGRTVEMP